MLNILEVVPKAKLYYYLSIFNNHCIVFFILFLFSLMLVMCLIRTSASLPNITNIRTYVVAILLIISFVCACMAIADDTNTPGSPRVTTCVHIKDNLHKIHIEKSQEHNVHNKLMKNHIKALIVNQQYYDDTHVKDIKPPLIQHKFL